MADTLKNVVDQPPVLPAPSPSRRRRKPSRTPYQKRQRRWQTIFPFIVIALGLVILAGALFRPGNPKSSKKSSTRTVSNVGAGVTGSTLLFGHVNAAGKADLLILFGLSGDKSSALMLPTGTQVEAPSFGIQTLSDLASFSDSSLLQLAIANALGVRVDSAALLNDKDLQKALNPTHGLQVDLTHSVTATISNHAKTFQAGTNTLSVSDAMALLTYEGKSGELASNVVHQAVLEGWLKKFATQGIAAQTVSANSGLAPLQGISQHKTQFITLPVQHLDVGSTELFSIQSNEIPSVMRKNFAGSLINSGKARPRVLVLNGTGTIGLAQKVAQCVVPAGGEVNLTGNVPKFGVQQTLVSFSQDADQTIASNIQAALGVGTLHKVQSTSDAVDITVEVGSDFHGCAVH